MRHNNISDPMKDLLSARKVNRLDRYQLENTIKPNTVSSHSHWVTIIAMLIYKDVNQHFKVNELTSLDYTRILEMATFHDLGECSSGDIDHSVKRAGVVDKAREKEYLKERFRESRLFVDFLNDIVIDHNDDQYLYWEKRLVKCADMLEHLLYCYEEQELFGNRSMEEPIKVGVEFILEEFKLFYRKSKTVSLIVDNCRETYQVDIAGAV